MWLKLWFNSIYFFDMNVGAGQAIRQGAIIDMIANTFTALKTGSALMDHRSSASSEGLFEPDTLL